MGIRMLHRRAAHGRAQTQAHAAAPLLPPPPPPPVPAIAATASTARIPTDLATALRRMTPPSPATGLRGVIAPGTGRIAARLARNLRHAGAALRYRFVERDRDAVRDKLQASR
ncbi:hypothetical protein M2271_004799 [Streptomyces sp. LBL]|uniref:hypothetical protein n=1 Tax=Streptomyces sp. LBL TaxID=2940562 RepID=UPI0024739C64|nr:hypothetical protein [Streptomyces sp. LBL]MDH6626976.1 hypothetical protein [Streptomyces sp. LBL]